MKTRILMLCVMASLYYVTYGSGRAYLSVKVVDADTGKPIPKIRVEEGFLNSSPGWGIAGKDNGDEAVTD